MKNNIIAFIFLTASLLMTAGDVFSAANEAGSIKDLKGSAQILREKIMFNAGMRSPVFVSDTVKTLKESRIKILFTDDSLLMLGENSTLVIPEYLKEAEGRKRPSAYKLINGALNVIVGKTPFEVHTSTTVAAARGTSYVIWTANAQNSKTGLAVTEGRVDIRNQQETAGEKIVVPAGKMSYIEEGKAPSPAVTAPPEVIEVLYRNTLAPEEIWGPVILRAKGSAIPPPDAVSPVQAKLMALRAAKVEALRNLSEQSYGVTIKSTSTVRDFVLENDSLKARVDAFVKGAWVSEERRLSDGSYEVEMELGLGIGFRRMLLGN